MRFIGDTSKIATASLATTENFKDRSGGKKSETTWHNLVFRGANAENITKYAKKGSPLFISGRISVRKYTDKDGAEKTAYEIEVREFRFLGGKGTGDSAPPARESDSEAGASQPAAAPATDKRGGSAFDDVDDDIPF